LHYSIIPSPHHPITPSPHYSIIPSFHHPIIPFALLLFFKKRLLLKDHLLRRKKMITTNKTLLLLLLSLIILALPVFSQESITGGPKKSSSTESVIGRKVEWGTSGYSSYQVSALTCMPLYSSTGYSWTMTGVVSRYCTSGFCLFECPVHLPGGASIVGLELDGCDSNASVGIWANLAKIPFSSSGSVTLLASAASSGSPGCDYFSGNSSAETVDNWNWTYWVEVGLDANDTSTVFSAVRVLYQLQVSPPPGSATFNDVPPSNPFFQFVEALAASGITGGCGGGNFCPNAYITRAQMAKFLAVALGLYFNYN